MSKAALPTEQWLSSFCRREGDLPGMDLPWLVENRAKARARFGELGLPTRAEEDWRFTDISPVSGNAFISSGGNRLSGADFEKLTLIPDESIRIVLVNGRFNMTLSKLAGLRGGAWVKDLAFALRETPEMVEPLLRRTDEEKKAFPSLNEAYFGDGTAIFVPRGAVLEAPVHILSITTEQAKPAISNTRVVAAVEAGAHAQVIEEFVALGEGVYFNNVMTDISLGEGAVVEHIKVQRESLKAYHVGGLRARLSRGSVFTSHCFSLGGALVRGEIEARLEGEGADCTLNGLYAAGDSQHVDNHTHIEHSHPHGTSRELYKGVLDGRAHAVFNGAITVRPGAQKTDSQVYNRNLLLSKDALIHTKPEFKINANDVQCKHGATIGQISEDALFYLRSRGLDKEACERLLIYAFASEMVELVTIPRLRKALQSSLGSLADEALLGDAPPPAGRRRKA